MRFSWILPGGHPEANGFLIEIFSQGVIAVDKK
jgi:hypothetical protein